MSTASLGMSGKLTTTKHYGSAQSRRKMSRVRHFGIPGLGRIAYTKDQGEAELFGQHFLDTNLHIIHRDSDGQVLLDENLGSGLVTNVGVLALANDYVVKFGKAKENFSFFSQLKWHQWGSKETAAATTDIKLTKVEAPNVTNGTEAVNSLTTNGKGEPVLISTATIKAESTLSIQEFGLFASKETTATKGTGKFVSTTATEGKGSGAVFTATSEEALGEYFKIAEATEAANIWGLILKNTTEVLTVPAWYKTSAGTTETPSGTSAYTMKPVMWDHKIFTSIGVESGNEIQFKYEVTLKSGG